MDLNFQRAYALCCFLTETANTLGGFKIKNIKGETKMEQNKKNYLAPELESTCLTECVLLESGFGDELIDDGNIYGYNPSVSL